MLKQAFKIIPKPKPKVPGWLNLLVVVSLIMVAAGPGIWFLLKHQSSKLESQKQEIEAELLGLEQGGLKDLEKSIFAVSKKIKDFSSFFSRHRITSELFELLRTFCHQRVQFTDLNLSADGAQINLGAVTDNFRTLGEQTLILKASPDVKDFKLFGISLDRDGRVKFSLTITL